MSELDLFIAELFKKLQRADHLSQEEIFYAIYDTCGEHLEKKGIIGNAPNKR